MSIINDMYHIYPNLKKSPAWVDFNNNKVKDKKEPVTKISEIKGIHEYDKMHFIINNFSRVNEAKQNYLISRTVSDLVLKPYDREYRNEQIDMLYAAKEKSLPFAMKYITNIKAPYRKKALSAMRIIAGTISKTKNHSYITKIILPELKKQLALDKDNKDSLSDLIKRFNKIYLKSTEVIEKEDVILSYEKKMGVTFPKKNSLGILKGMSIYADVLFGDKKLTYAEKKKKQGIAMDFIKDYYSVNLRNYFEYKKLVQKLKFPNNLMLYNIYIKLFFANDKDRNKKNKTMLLPRLMHEQHKLYKTHLECDNASLGFYYISRLKKSDKIIKQGILKFEIENNNPNITPGHVVSYFVYKEKGQAFTLMADNNDFIVFKGSDISVIKNWYNNSWNILSVYDVPKEDLNFLIEKQEKHEQEKSASQDVKKFLDDYYKVGYLRDYYDYYTKKGKSIYENKKAPNWRYIKSRDGKLKHKETKRIFGLNDDKYIWFYNFKK